MVVLLFAHIQWPDTMGKKSKAANVPVDTVDSSEDYLRFMMRAEAWQLKASLDDPGGKNSSLQARIVSTYVYQYCMRGI